MDTQTNSRTDGQGLLDSASDPGQEYVHILKGVGNASFYLFTNVPRPL